MSNCGVSYESFNFELWDITKLSPGQFNKCQGGVDDDQLPSCHVRTPSASGSTNSLQRNEESSCVENTNDMINSLHDSEFKNPVNFFISNLRKRITCAYFMENPNLDCRVDQKKEICSKHI